MDKLFSDKIRRIRKRILRVSYENQRPHIGSNLSCVEILASLFFGTLKEKDKFLLSKGHAGLALYSVLAERGLLEEEETSKLASHPYKNPKLGVEFTAGSLGQGLSVGCGLALADKNRKVYVLLGDGECEEGSVWEAVNFASEHGLANLTAIIDANGWQESKKAMSIDNLIKRWQAFGWEVIKIIEDGSEINFERCCTKPSVFIVKTKKGKGLPFMEDKIESHSLKLTKEQYEEGIC